MTAQTGVLTSARLTLMCLAVAVVLVLAGTLAQAGRASCQAQTRYFRSFIVWWSLGNTGVSLPILPPADPAKSRDGWQNTGVALRDSIRTGQVRPPVAHLAAMSTAFTRGMPAEFIPLSTRRGWPRTGDGGN